MGLLDRLRRGRPGTLRSGDRADQAHLRDWARTHRGGALTGQPFSAMSCSTDQRVRTGTPVPPLLV